LLSLLFAVFLPHFYDLRFVIFFHSPDALELSSEQDDELQDEIQDKTEEIKDLVRALRSIPIMLIPAETARSDPFVRVVAAVVVVIYFSCRFYFSC
jgi:hypothetical protein